MNKVCGVLLLSVFLWSSYSYGSFVVCREAFSHWHYFLSLEWSKMTAQVFTSGRTGEFWQLIDHSADISFNPHTAQTIVRARVEPLPWAQVKGCQQNMPYYQFRLNGDLNRHRAQRRGNIEKGQHVLLRPGVPAADCPLWPLPPPRLESVVCDT